MAYRPCPYFIFKRDRHIDGLCLGGFALVFTWRLVCEVQADVLESLGATAAGITTSTGYGNEAAVDKGPDVAQFSQESVPLAGIELDVVFGVHI
jgi:hypothetical protein